MAFVHQQTYTGRGVKGEIAITKNKNGTKAVTAILEVTKGTEAGQRVRWRGYLTGPGGAPSAKNLEATTAELRAMGWTGARWGDWAGFGSREVTFHVLREESDDRGPDGRAKTYLRAAFVQALRTLNRAAELTGDDLADLPPPPPVGRVNGTVAAHAPAPASGEADADAGEEIPF